MISGGYLLVAAKVAISIFVNQLNATNLKSSKTQFKLGAINLLRNREGGKGGHLKDFITKPP